MCAIRMVRHHVLISVIFFGIVLAKSSILAFVIYVFPFSLFGETKKENNRCARQYRSEPPQSFSRLCLHLGKNPDEHDRCARQYRSLSLRQSFPDCCQAEFPHFQVQPLTLVLDNHCLDHGRQ